ncbi:MAG: capsule assembly Wzi family protein [Acidobacteriota bacterium]|nr:capsule assembly Wzi family protein [Acidobacteriota bacterium]
MVRGFHRTRAQVRLSLWLALSAVSSSLAAQAPSTPPPQPSTQAIPAYPGYDTRSQPAPQPPAPPQNPPAGGTAAPAPAAARPAVETPQAYAPYGPGASLDEQQDQALGSTYIPLDSWIYPAMSRLYSMGYLDTMFLGLRPYTRRSALHMLQASQSAIVRGTNLEAQQILAALLDALNEETVRWNRSRGPVYGVESVYARATSITGPVLRDSFHLGQTISNDYGRPFERGFNSLLGVSTVNEMGRFSLYVRGEYQHAPAGTGYSAALANQLSVADYVGTYAPPNAPQATIPAGALPSQNNFRLQEAALSAHLLGHEISLGKTDAWLGPGQGGAGAWSNNAEDIYSFRINRVEPVRIPLLSRVLGPVRYDFFYGSLKGHTAPNHPWTHSDQFSFRPTRNVEIGFQRTIIFGGAGHEPVTLRTFLKGFFDPNDTTSAEKYSRMDPGARFSDFTASWRLPGVRQHLTFYVDSFVHDDVTPISAPRRSAFRTGLYLSQVPRLPKLDLRVEAVSTDPDTGRSLAGQFYYWEVIQNQGYTNKGLLMGDPIGREAKGGQAWLTYHLSGAEWVQLSYMNKKIPHDFVPGGTTQNQFRIDVVKRLTRDVELKAWLQHESWKAPVYLPGAQGNTVTAFQVTWYPKLKTAVEP